LRYSTGATIRKFHENSGEFRRFGTRSCGGFPPDDFERDRTRVKELTERFCRTDRDWEWAAHPLFGPMSDQDWLRWGYLHADHYLRQFGA
jgi:hypothetical protein